GTIIFIACQAQRLIAAGTEPESHVRHVGQQREACRTHADMPRIELAQHDVLGLQFRILQMGKAKPVSDLVENNQLRVYTRPSCRVTYHRRTAWTCYLV